MTREEILKERAALEGQRAYMRALIAAVEKDLTTRCERIGALDATLAAIAVEEALTAQETAPSKVKPNGDADAAPAEEGTV